MPWNIPQVERDLQAAYAAGSETQLLRILKENTFLFHELHSRPTQVQPIFHEVSFGGELRCDFAWLNDSSDGPEWVLIEIEKPGMPLFRGDGKPSAELNGAIEQVKSWERYFQENPAEKGRIFGAVGRFRLVLVAGDKNPWSTEAAMKWRKHNNANTTIEIRSTDVFLRSLELIKTTPDIFSSFEEQPISLPHASLTEYWTGYRYMDLQRQIFGAS